MDQFTHSLMNVPEVTHERVLTRDKNGDFSQRVIDTLFRLTTMDCSRIFAVLRETIYLQPTGTNGLATVCRSLGDVVSRTVRHGRIPTCHNLFSQG